MTARGMHLEQEVLNKDPAGGSSSDDSEGIAQAECSRDSAVKMSNGHVTSYDETKLSTFAALCTCTATVFQMRLLWAEQIGLFVLTLAACLYSLRSGMEAGSDEITKFGGKMWTLAVFLLAFHTSLTVNRWWRLRTSGIGNMWSACSQLSMFISTTVTRDAQVLNAIQRYAAASLAILFLRRRDVKVELSKKLPTLTKMGLLTREEVQKLQAWDNNLAESIWTWICQIVADLYTKGLIKSEIHFNFLLERVNLGRSGAALICAQMGCQVPLPYVHLLTTLVKLHNIILSLCYGYNIGVDLHASGSGPTRESMASAIFVGSQHMFSTLLLNAILLVNADLADPWNGTKNDFPLHRYTAGFLSDGRSYVDAGEHLPAWMQTGK